MYWSMLRGIALVCIVDPTNTVDLTCLLECNVFGGITAVGLSRCRSIYLTLCGSNITSSSLLHRKYLLLLCCLLKVSQYRLALIDTASVYIVKGISQHIHNNPPGAVFQARLLDTQEGANTERYVFGKLSAIGFQHRPFRHRYYSKYGDIDHGKSTQGCVAYCTQHTLL